MGYVSQGIKRKAARNKNAKYKIKFNKYQYSNTTPATKTISLSYSKTISKSSNLRYKEQ